MSTNCIRCIVQQRTGPDLLCNLCRAREFDAEACRWIIEEGAYLPDVSTRAADLITVIVPEGARTLTDDERRIVLGLIDEQRAKRK